MALQLENWDDDEEIQGDIFNNSISKASHLSSRLSIRSDSIAGDDDWEVPIVPQDPKSTSDAILSAKQAGIPLPSNVPASALLGGAIKRLGKQPSRQNLDGDWDDDLDFSEQNPFSLKVKTTEPSPQTPADAQDDFDDWAEGSLGVRFGGTRRDSKGRNWGSSGSALSPSMGSCKTMESEDDGLDGLVIPTGPLDFEAALMRAKIAEEDAPRHIIPNARSFPRTPVETLDDQKDDFFAGIDIGQGDVFDTQKKTLNRNLKTAWKPARNQESTPIKTQTTISFTDKSALTKIPRPVLPGRPNRLDPVFESGANNVTRPRRIDPPTNNASGLRSKRSMPALRNPPLPAPKPPPVPFLPAGIARPQAHYLNGKPNQLYSRRESDPHRAQSPTPRSHSRLSTSFVPETPTRQRRDLAPASLAREAAAKRTVTRPARRRNFGDGSELDMFDDLPTSVAKENKFVKQPSQRAPPKALRPTASQTRLVVRDKPTTPLSAPTPRAGTKVDNLPRFARDTAASRIAREQKLGQSGQQPKLKSEALSMPRINWPAQIAARTPQTSPTANRTLRKGPQLINPMGKDNNKHFENDAVKKGMRWNAHACRWEGNENVLLSFEAAAPPSPPRPALITNVTGAQGVQVVGGMVFDPQRMCWLKLGATPSDPRSPSIDEDDDPFGGIEDLQESKPGTTKAGALGGRGGVGGSEWLVGEEFDLGPEFIRRQREEESLWRSKVASWIGSERDREGDAWKWAIRDIAATATQ